MTLRRLLVPLFLLACLLAGGASNAGFVANLILQLLALPILAWAAVHQSFEANADGTRALLLLAVAVVGVVLLQLAPLPPAVWTLLPGRAGVTAGLALLGQPPGWLPISLAPEATLAGLLCWLPAFAVLCGMVRLGAFQPAWIAMVVAAAAVLGVTIGAPQIVGGQGSAWYLYAFTNWGQAVGFFANANHNATLLVATIPFIAALQASALGRRRSMQRASAMTMMAAALFVVVAVGLVINFSFAGLGLALPVTVASLVLLGASGEDRRLRWAGIAIVLLIAAVLALVIVNPFADSFGAKLASSETSIAQLKRAVSIPTTLRAALDYLPTGSGLGSFVGVYHLYEDPAAIVTTYMNHAHSDVAEVLLELGASGALLMLALLLWWLRRTIALWRAPVPDVFARAGAIASGAIMAHSLVDYPLRTAAISALFAACLALMAEVRPFTRAERDMTRVRHLSAD